MVHAPTFGDTSGTSRRAVKTSIRMTTGNCFEHFRGRLLIEDSYSSK
jgi:hypothetical protein